MALEETIIQLKHMGKEFKTANGPVKALDDINLEIKRGEIFGIIGLSGAGKSTLVRCINMLEIPTSGEVLFEGENLAALSEAGQRKARQIRFLEGKGFQHVGTWQFENAKNLIDRIAANGWQVPDNINRQEYRG